MRTMIQSVLVSVLLVGFTVAGAQAADCTKWGKDRFWKKATAANVRTCLEAGADPNVRKGKWPPLHRAAVHTNYPGVIKALVDAGADLEARGDNLTPLHRAAGWRGGSGCG